MICKHCGASFTGNVCPVCKKEAVLNDRSRDFEKLMEGVTPAVPVPPPADISGKTYQQGLQEGLQKGYRNGFSKGKEEGLNEARKADPGDGPKGETKDKKDKKKTVILLAACVLTACLVSGGLSYLLFHNSVYNKGDQAGYTRGFGIGDQHGYNDGETAGKQQGYKDGLAAGMQHGYEAGSVFGNMQGYASGIVIGNQYGNASGSAKGKTEGYDEGLSAGYNNGFGDGYDARVFAETYDLPEITEPLKNGSKEDKKDKTGPVHILQTALKALGKNLTPDGEFGKVTESRVQSYQEEHLYPVTGEVDAVLFARICYEARIGGNGENVDKIDAALDEDTPSIEQAPTERNEATEQSGAYKLENGYVIVDVEITDGVLKISHGGNLFLTGPLDLCTGISLEDIAGEYKAEKEPREDGKMYYVNDNGAVCYFFFSDADETICLDLMYQDKSVSFKKVD